MKAPLTVGFAVVMLLGGIAGPRPAAAQACPIGCGMQTRACVQTARVRKLACKHACRGSAPSAGLGACMRSCRDGFRSAKDACGGDHAICVDICPPPPPPSSCVGAILDTCGQQLAACAKTVVMRAKACIQGCGPGTQRPTCLERCAEAAETGAGQCAADFAACISRCRPPMTTTTTLPRTCGLDPAVGSCAGECPTGLICAPPPPESGVALACICRPRTTPCQSNQDCRDDNPCTGDLCVNGTCEHPCLCLDAGGATTCCPGPSNLCPPPVFGRCFITVDGQCSDEPCGPGQPCRNPNEICRPECVAPPTTTTTLPDGGCTIDTDCNDDNPCTADHCVNGRCEHGCLCLDAQGASSCCPGPASLCVRPCGRELSGTCGGSCPSGASCESVADPATCECVSGVGGPCGGNIFGPPPVCAPGLVCKQSNPDVVGVCVSPTTTTMPTTCIPFFQLGCSQTADCCEPCEPGRIAPCAVCLQGECMGAP
jgi:hypothetical protein